MKFFILNLKLFRKVKGAFCQKSPFSLWSLEEKKGIFDRKLSFPGQGEMGVLDPETLFSRKGGFGPFEEYDPPRVRPNATG